MFTDVIYTNITYFKLQVSVPLSLIYHLWSYYNNSAIYNANKSIPTENTLDLDSALRKSSHQETIVSFPDPFQIKAFDRALLALL